jgi:hypothetical protein
MLDRHMILNAVGLTDLLLELSIATWKYGLMVRLF